MGKISWNLESAEERYHLNCQTVDVVTRRMIAMLELTERLLLEAYGDDPKIGKQLQDELGRIKEEIW